MLKIYLSGPLFSRADIAWGARVKSFLEERLPETSVLWPHEIAPCSAGIKEIFQANIEALNEADLMVALLDGSQVDDGTAWEVGFFHSQGKKVLGLRTDLRRAGEMDGSRVNLMIECSCHSISSRLEELLDQMQRLMF
jgi:nucleoside 2-deoxyribosyltransferase